MLSVGSAPSEGPKERIYSRPFSLVYRWLSPRSHGIFLVCVHLSLFKLKSRIIRKIELPS